MAGDAFPVNELLTLLETMEQHNESPILNYPVVNCILLLICILRGHLSMDATISKYFNLGHNFFVISIIVKLYF